MELINVKHINEGFNYIRATSFLRLPGGTNFLTLTVTGNPVAEPFLLA